MHGSEAVLSEFVPGTGAGVHTLTNSWLAAANTVPQQRGAYIKDVQRERRLLCYCSSLHDSDV